jgi:segregation and condensation protein A
MSRDFKIETDVYQGPFSVLLDLIEKHKLSINEISLSKITDEYINKIKTIDNASFGDISSFIVIAATLMLIKSRSLLPSLTVTKEEESDINVLEKRLEVFQLIKAISLFVKNSYMKKVLYKRPFVKIKIQKFSPDVKITEENIFRLALETLQNVPKELKLPETKVKQSIKIENVILSLLERVKKESKISFSNFSKAGTASLETLKEIKVFIVVSFLAVLELVKNGELEAEQDENFGEITINS